VPKAIKKEKAEEMPEQPPKKLEEYEVSRPEQLDLFELMLPAEKKYSNTIELYDFMPKYHWGKVERVEGYFLHPLRREFECRGVRYQLRIAPASVDDKEGVARDYFPGKREELVEDALRKLASEGQAVFLDDEVSVTFTLYQLQQELKKTGHSYSLPELKEALLVCAGTNISVTTENGSSVLVGNLFETLGLQSREDWQGAGKKTKAFVRFNSLVTKGIRHGLFRRFNYEKSMGYRSVIARQLHKRMAHHYTQASITQPYHILLTTIIRDFGLTEYERLSMNLRNVLIALDEMVEKGVVLSYKVEKTLETDLRNKLVEAKLILTPHPHFVSEVMHANAAQGQRKLPSKGQN
jgi:hypothetical protein